MLQSLHISNYALIDKIDIEFGKGLNIITGETGAGKSIILGALSLLQGERADMRTIRNKEQKTVVEAVFELQDEDLLKDVFLKYEFEPNGNECILRRELTSKGTSRSFVNDTPVNLSVMKEISDRLLDIHTQHSNALLNLSKFQIEILDVLAGNEELVKDYRNKFNTYKKCLKRYSDFKERYLKLLNENEFNSYLLEQLEKVDVRKGEQADLERERELIVNSAVNKRYLTTVLECLSDSDESILNKLSKAEEALANLSDVVSEAESLKDRLGSVAIELKDIYETVEQYDTKVLSSAEDVENIDCRLEAIYAIKKRHNVTSDDELLQIVKRLREAKSDVENGENTLNQLEEEAKDAKKAAVLSAREISASRLRAAQEFEKLLTEKAMPLGMANLQCKIKVTQGKLNESGQDSIEFLFAFNKNQPLMPIGNTASGGEISRIFLCIKSILVEKMNLPTIIYDEIDTGVSGEVATKMANLMLETARFTQVITITHIAAVAARGERHFKIFKEDGEDMTFTFVRNLDAKDRERELALMISGDPNDNIALETARVLLRAGSTIKK